MQDRSIATYGRLTIVQVDRDNSTPREYGERFYIIVDQNDQRLSRTFQYLANARKEAARMARGVEA